MDCGRKQQHPTRELAEAHARQLERTGYPAHSYWCERHQAYHVGRIRMKGR